MVRKWAKRLLILLVFLGAVAAGVVFCAPWMARWYVENRLLPRLERRLSRSIAVKSIEVGLHKVVLQGIILRSPDDNAQSPPMAAIPRISADHHLASLLGGRLEVPKVEVEGPVIQLWRRKNGVSNFLDLLSGQSPGGGKSGPGKLRIGQVRILGGKLTLKDHKTGAAVTIKSLTGSLRPRGTSSLVLSPVLITAPGFAEGISFKQIKAVLAHGGPKPPEQWPLLQLAGGKLRILPRLELTGIQGTLQPGKRGKVHIALDGSYGGAKARLWSASGWVDPRQRKGALEVAAKRFTLGRIASLLKRSPVILPQQTSLDGKLEINLDGQFLTFDGGFSVNKLNLFHPGLSRDPVLDISGKVVARGQADLEQQKLILQELTLSSRGVSGTLAGIMERRDTTPMLDLTFKVPPVPCQKVLQSIPPSLVPHLQGFALRGTFSMDLGSHIDFNDLDHLTLGGKVGIYNCKVIKAPDPVSAERLMNTFEHQVEVKPGEFQIFKVGLESGDFVPYGNVAPTLVHAFLTTEDGGFFRHKGFITSQFDKALARNLKRGGFRLGASTITMQMVKNALLNHDKTLSRKLQEMFLTWYLEQNLTKERIMEIYLNIIEFGPGIYGIGAAADHYFDKDPRDIQPLEAAFFATLLPSPKRRYEQYCHGKLTDKWDRYVKRVLKRMASKGFVDKLALAEAEASQIIFSRDPQALTPKDCLQNIKILVESWQEERRIRLRKAILKAAPHQLDMYIKD